MYVALNNPSEWSLSLHVKMDDYVCAWGFSGYALTFERKVKRTSDKEVHVQNAHEETCQGRDLLSLIHTCTHTHLHMHAHV